jgi:hypothetical protein
MLDSKMGEHRLVPVRWMAPESIERRVFSSESGKDFTPLAFHCDRISQNITMLF